MLFKSNYINKLTFPACNREKRSFLQVRLFNFYITQYTYHCNSCIVCDHVHCILRVVEDQPGPEQQRQPNPVKFRESLLELGID